MSGLIRWSSDAVEVAVSDHDMDALVVTIDAIDDRDGLIIELSRAEARDVITGLVALL